MVEETIQNVINHYNKELKRLWVECYLAHIKYGYESDKAKYECDMFIKHYQQTFPLYPVVVKDEN